MEKWKAAGMRSNRAEMVSAAVQANLRRRKDLPIAQALQPVAAVAWAVVDGLAGEDELFAATLEAEKKIALHTGAFAERMLLGQILCECAPDEDDEDDAGDDPADGDGNEAAGETDAADADAAPATGEVPAGHLTPGQEAA